MAVDDGASVTVRDHGTQKWTTHRLADAHIKLGTITRLALAARGQLAVLDPKEIDADEETPAKIPTEDEKDLRWYFAEERRTAAEGGGGSNFDAAIARMNLYQKRAKPCTKCGGAREVVDEDGTVIVEATGGTGFIFDSKQFQEWMRIGRVAKLDRDRNAVAAWLLRNNAREVSRAGRDGRKWTETMGSADCPRCCPEGEESPTPGWIVTKIRNHGRTPTVRVTGTTYTSSAQSTGGDESLARMGKVGRRRAAVRAKDPVAEAAIEAFYSPDGGSEACLWHLTPAGRQMLEENNRGLPEQAFFRALRLTQEKNNDPRMAKFFRDATRQARQLRRRMCRVWNEVVHG